MRSALPSPLSSARFGLPADQVDQQFRGHSRPIGADGAGHIGRPRADIGGQRGLERGGQGFDGRFRTVVSRADAQLGHPPAQYG